MESQYLTNKSFSHSKTVPFSLSSKDNTKYSDLKISSDKHSLKYGANPSLTKYFNLLDPIPFFQQLHCQETCF